LILIVGATGRLGSTAARMLIAQGKRVRAMSRTALKVRELETLGAEIAIGDLRDLPSLRHACQGVSHVLAAAHAFDEQGDNTPRNVDEVGNCNMIDVARASGVEHFVLTSAHDVRPDHEVDFFRHKFRAEEHLRGSGLSYTILRPTPFMEFWSALIGRPVLTKGRATIFGRGVNPVNFVAVDDVARFALMSLHNPAARNQIIEIGGPENLTLLQVVETFERASGLVARKAHVPVAVMKVMSALLRRIRPGLSRQISAGVYMDTADMTLDMRETLHRFPMQLTTLEDVVRDNYAKSQ
jgi:uncharacterized protein YbjT (DUF2867 family)